MDDKPTEDPVEIVLSTEESDEEELFFDQDILTYDTEIKVIGEVYEQETIVMKGDWDVIHDDDAIRNDLIEYYEDEAIRETRRSSLTPIQKYRLVDKTDSLIRLVLDYSNDRMGIDRSNSISQRFKLTQPSIAIRKRCFGEVNDLYGPLIEEPFGRLGMANIRYDMTDIHPHVRHYSKGRFINKSLIPIVDDVKKYYIDTENDDEDDVEIVSDKAYKLFDEIDMLYSGEDSLLAKHNVYHPTISNDKYKKNGMTRDLYDSKRYEIEQVYINTSSDYFNVDVNNFTYWGEGGLASTYEAYRQKSVDLGHKYSADSDYSKWVKLISRRIFGPDYRYYDKFREGEIKKISGNDCCIGTVEDNVYENKYNKTEDDVFMYQINTPPEKKEYIQGETVNISGYMYKSPNTLSYTDKGVNIVDIINNESQQEFIYFKCPVDFENVESNSVRNNFLKSQIKDIKHEINDILESSEIRKTEDILSNPIKNNCYRIEDTVFRYAPHYKENKFYHGYTVLSDVRNITSVSLYPRDYKIIDWGGKCSIVDSSIIAVAYQFKNLYFPELYSSMVGQVATFVDEIVEGGLVLWKGEQISHFNSVCLINRVKKIHKTTQKTKNGFKYNIVLQHVHDDGLEYVLHKNELQGMVEKEAGYFKKWLSNTNYIDNKHTFRNKHYSIHDVNKFIKQVELFNLKPQEVLLYITLPSISLILDDLSDIMKDITKNFGSGNVESNIPNFRKMLSQFGIDHGDIYNDSSSRVYFKIRDELLEQVIRVIRDRDETLVLNTSTRQNIRKIIGEQDSYLYEKLLKILPFSDEVSNERTNIKFLERVDSLRDGLPSNSRALDVYIGHKNTDSMEQLLKNTIDAYINGRENYQNYITHFYNLLIYNIPYHKNFSKIHDTTNESIIDYSTELFDIYEHINQEINRKLSVVNRQDRIMLNRFDYKRLCNELHKSYDNGDYYYNVVNLIKLHNDLDHDGDSESEDGESIEKLELEYKLVRNIYENEREKSNMYKDTCNNVIVVKIYKSREALEGDNYVDEIKIDPEFETLEADMKIFNMIRAENKESEEWKDEKWHEILLEKMRDYYIFANPTVLKYKIDNILKNRDILIHPKRAYRNVREGEHAILINLYERHIYKRVRNIWVIHEVAAINEATCSTDELAIVHKTFEDVLRDIGSAHKYMNSDYFDSNCLPQSILGWAKRMKDISDKIQENKDNTMITTNSKILIEKYKNELRDMSKRLLSLKSRNEYFRKREISNATIVRPKICPFSKLITEARNASNLRDTLTFYKEIINDYDWTDILPEQEDDAKVDEGLVEDFERDEIYVEQGSGHKGDKGYLFSAETPEIIEKLQVDDVALYSVSDSVIAIQMSDILTKHIKNDGLGNGLVIADGMACVGGNSIAFARNPYFKRVISNELDENRYKMLKNNLLDVLEFNNIDISNGSILNAEFLKEIDILFLDPEWSDKDGVSVDNITIGKVNLDTFVDQLFNFENMKMIALKLPYTYDKSLLSKFNKANGFNMNTYYLGQYSNILYIIISKTVKQETDDDEIEGEHTNFLYPVDSPNPMMSRICKHCVDMFPIITMNDQDAIEHIKTVASKWCKDSNGFGNYICKNCGELVYIRENADEQFQTRSGESTVSREVSQTSFKRSMDKLLDVDDERFNDERRTIYTIISDILRVVKVVLSKEQLENLCFSGDFMIEYPKSIVDIRNIGAPFDNKKTFNMKNNIFYKHTLDSTGAGNTNYMKRPYSDLPKIIPFYKKLLKNPGTFKQFTDRWNEYIDEVFDKPGKEKYAKDRETLYFSSDNKDERFVVENWEDFASEFIRKRSKDSNRTKFIFGLFKILYGIAAYAKVYLYKYYSTLIIRSISKLIVLLQAESIRTDDNITFFGFPMKNLPVAYSRLGEFPIPQLVNKIKTLSLDKNRRGKYPWTVFADSHITEEKLVEFIKTDLIRITKIGTPLRILLDKRSTILQEYELIGKRLSEWPTFRPYLKKIVPKKWKKRGLDKLSLTELEGYYRNISDNIISILNTEIGDENLISGNFINNSCCLSSVHLDYDIPITNYFAYFTHIIGKNENLVSLFDEAYRVDRKIRMVKSKYTVMRYDEPRELREKLLNYMTMNFEETVQISDRTYTLKNISLKNNIFLNYCYNKENFGQRRIFKKMTDVDLYLYNEILEEMAEDNDDTGDIDEIEKRLLNKLNKKYNGLLSDAEMRRKLETIIRYNGEYEICVMSGIRRYDIIKHLEDIITRSDGSLEKEARRLNKYIRLENVLRRDEISSSIFYTPTSYIDQARDIITTLEILSLYIPEHISPTVHMLKEHTKEIMKKPKPFKNLIGVEPETVSYEIWLSSFANKKIYTRVSDVNSQLNKNFKTYSENNYNNWTKKIGNLETRFNYVENNLETSLRILGYSESDIKREIKLERVRLKAEKRRVAMMETKKYLINLKFLIGIFNRICDKDLDILEDYNTGFSEQKMNVIKEVFSSSGFKTRLSKRMDVDFPIDIINYFVIPEIYNKCNSPAISLFGYDSITVFLKLIIIEICNYLFITSDKKIPSKSLDAEYNRNIAKLLDTLFIENIIEEFEFNNISKDKIESVNNLLMGIKNNKRLEDYNEVQMDEASGLHKAYRTIGMGREFNAGRGFSDTINISDIYNADISNFDSEYADGEIDGSKMGISGDYGGEDYHDEPELF